MRTRTSSLLSVAPAALFVFTSILVGQNLWQSEIRQEVPWPAEG
jgi:hypothetical protein